MYIYNIYITYIYIYIYIYIKLKNSSSTAFSQTGFSEVFYKVKFIRPNQLWHWGSNQSNQSIAKAGC